LRVAVTTLGQPGSSRRCGTVAAARKAALPEPQPFGDAAKRRAG